MSTTITFTLPDDVLRVIDAQQQSSSTSRNDFVRDFIVRTLGAPDDDDTLTPEEIEAIKESRAAHTRGEFITLEEVKEKYRHELQPAVAKPAQKNGT